MLTDVLVLETFKACRPCRTQTRVSLPHHPTIRLEKGIFQTILVRVLHAHGNAIEVSSLGPDHPATQTTTPFAIVHPSSCGTSRSFSSFGLLQLCSSPSNAFALWYVSGDSQTRLVSTWSLHSCFFSNQVDSPRTPTWMPTPHHRTWIGWAFISMGSCNHRCIGLCCKSKKASTLRRVQDPVVFFCQ